MNSKFHVPFKTAKLLKEKGFPQDSEDYIYFSDGERKRRNWLTFYQLDNLNAVICPTYHEVLDWLDINGYIVTIEYDYSHNDGIYSFRTVVYNLDNKLYTSEWATSREYALNDGITKILEDYL